MDLSSLKNSVGARHRKRRIGRGPGSGTGKTSGKGHKGQMARKGNKHKPGFEGGQMPLIRRLPKRGQNNKPRSVFAPVNVGMLDVAFEDGAEITMVDLKKNGLAKGPFDGIKILGCGEITKKLTVKATAFSKSAREKIEAAGGTCEVI
jgi:large subunit ribosomal protein L15